eukprot:CAMPEP_0175072820 /NCGR_PEP_ID=MMETSP0052_2-20121109/20152_1 /TAXON_ID=51329 ORGANISM="Polytomella parva, Strain SAG 63-3" /NCGR_SAMPLE_ID=MMETSP0052_2 /ASSEMBLY_ACC=CAM_ASM_000194 /LENGTH=432 /DNA_ID=CAMNT_0016340427 /DNA_START=25 /DNA_END=1323 /DNA_ORIENTATION=-
MTGEEGKMEPVVEKENELEERPPIIARSGKRPCGQQGRKEDDIDDDQESVDPGTWTVDPSAIEGRRKVVVRRNKPQVVSSDAKANPFAGVSLFGAAAPVVANPLASISFAAPSKKADESTKDDAENASSEKDDTTASKDEEIKRASGGIFGAAFSSGGFGSVLGSGFGGGLTGFGSSSATPSFNFGSFGASSTPNVFAFGSSSTAADGADEDPEAPSTATFKPVVTLPEVVKVTGEEDEASLFSEKGKLYEFERGANQWRERGLGEFKINSKTTSTTTGEDEGDSVASTSTTHRLLMRQDGGLRLLLNAKVFTGMSLALMEGRKGITFTCMNSASGPTQTDFKKAEKKEDGERKSEAIKEEKAKEEGAKEPSKEEAKESETKDSSTTSVALSTWAVRFKSADRAESCLAILKSLSARPTSDEAANTATEAAS